MTSAGKDDNPAVIIREMTKADLPVVITMEQEIYPDPWSEQAFLELWSMSDWGASVAELDGRIIGYACYFVVDVETHLTNIAVVRQYRRKSVAKKLLEHIFRIAKNRSCEYILLEVRPGNAAAVAFYEKHGFGLMYRRPGYYREPVEDALVMVRYLYPEEQGD